MIYEDRFDIVNHPELDSVREKLLSAGVTRSDIDNAIATHFAGTNPGEAIALRMARDCLLQLLKKQVAKPPENAIGRFLRHFSWLLTWGG